MTSDPQRILIFGGTFDPPHLAHAKLPPVVADSLGCGKIIYVPAALNPLKSDTPPTPVSHRLAMLHLVVDAIPHAEIDTLELDREGPSYTVDTLVVLRQRYGEDSNLHLLIGADHLLTFTQWKDWQRILKLAEPVVMPRPPWPREKLIEEIHQRFDSAMAAFWIDRLVDVPYLEVSATDVRDKITTNQDLIGTLDKRVIDYIRRHDLYAPDSRRNA
ncbi:MAG: nicotinate (nicotinamide) nucleotide adenylyltransferase [Planctomycetes bacterium]|nr:nicotinate (nicotinamide) nucleotide adenylyltransferase [Planctomycetota bacterium]